jgi:GDPmannose 4,6-dehydratase
VSNTILITGITGQDGIYLTEFMLGKGYHVVGAVRDSLRAEQSLPDTLMHKIELVDWDMLNQQQMTDVLAQYRPCEIYNFAAYSSGTGMYDDPVQQSEINGLAVTRIMEAIRKVDRNIRFCQASSREIFGDAKESPQTENTPANPRSPYGAAKLYADHMLRIYRKHHKIFACSAILFNHESPRRGLTFVTRKVTLTAAKIKLGLATELPIGNLDAERDWGFSGDTVRAMWLMLQQPHPDDYVIATGETHSVREFCEYAFRHLDLDYLDYVKEDSSAFRISEQVKLVGNAGKAREKLGWAPEVGFKELISMMVDSDLRMLSREGPLTDGKDDVSEN